MNAFAKYFDNNGKYRNLLVNDKEILKKTMQCGVKVIIY